MADKTTEPLRPDIQHALDRMSSVVGAKREIRKSAGHLWDSEQVEMLASGAYGRGIGLLTLTNRRLLFTFDGWTNSPTEDVPLERISSVQWESGMLQGTLTVFVFGNKAEIKNMEKLNGKAVERRGDVMHGV